MLCATRLKKILLLLIIFCCQARAVRAQVLPTAPLVQPPAIDREFRAAWVATVANIDWPSQKGLPVAIQKQQLTNIVNRAAQLKLNTLLFQVRPACDALYSSQIEPWSEFITGIQGDAPIPAYDPLAYLIHAAHLKGIQVQAWFNPFRARFPLSKSPLARNQVIRRHPDWIVHYGDQTWLNPGIPQVQHYVLKIVMDVVKRYNIDGVHMDDYFYPYPEKSSKGGYLPFNDVTAFSTYKTHGGNLPLNRWRRHNIDDFVQRLYLHVKAMKPWVLFGISPFGIWQPSHPPTITGYNSYKMIYCDSRLWIRNGWCDYLAPQLYWRITQHAQSFPVLLNWWAHQNYKHRHIWPGLYIDKVNGPPASGAWPASEITNEIQITRAVPNSEGAVMFSMVTLLRNGGGIDNALPQVYRHVALVPSSPWLGMHQPPKPACKLETDSLTAKENNQSEVLSWHTNTSTVTVRWWALQVLSSKGWHTTVLPADCVSVPLPEGSLEASIIAISPSGIPSPNALVNLRPSTGSGGKRQNHPDGHSTEQFEQTGASK